MALVCEYCTVRMTSSETIMVGQMDSKDSRVNFVLFQRTFVIITSHCYVIRENIKLEV